MKSKIITLIFVLLGCFAIYFFFFTQPESRDYPDESTYSARQNELPLITYETQSTDIADRKIKIIKTTPKVKIYSKSLSSEKANDYINRFIDDRESRFNRLVEEDSLKSSQPQNIYNSFSLFSETVFNSPKIFTIKFSENISLISKPKQDKYIRYIIFDTEKSKTLFFEDIFINNDELISFLTNKYASSTDDNLIVKSIKSKHNISINKNGLTIVIDEEKNNPSAIESKELIIPLDIISPYLNSYIKDQILAEKEYIRMSEPE